MKQSARLLGALCVLTLTAVACFPETVRVTPAPSTAAPTIAAPTATSTPFTPPGFGPTSAPATPVATPTAPPTAPASPGSTPATACPPLTGGSQANRVIVTDVRVAHNPGFDRIVFEFGPNPG